MVLDFALGERRYRVERSPEQMRPKLRGEGLTRQPSTATLWERTDAAGDAEGTVLASRWGEVTEKVVELLGFRSDQFRQVIVLPQGRFRDLLLANSNDREKILQQLFDTSFYKRVQEALKARAGKLRKTAEDLKSRRQALLEQAECESETDLDALIERFDVGGRLICPGLIDSHVMNVDFTRRIAHLRHVDSVVSVVLLPGNHDDPASWSVPSVKTTSPL